jgi:hypothetical protein
MSSITFPCFAKVFTGLETFSICPPEANINPPIFGSPFICDSLDIRENLSMAMFCLLRASGIFSNGFKGMQSISCNEFFTMSLKKENIQIPYQLNKSLVTTISARKIGSPPNLINDL